jgi:hypothetical protein
MHDMYNMSSKEFGSIGQVHHSHLDILEFLLTLECRCLCQTRVALLSKLLVRRIKPYVEGDEEGFRRAITREADKLACVPFGVPLLHVIG